MCSNGLSGILSIFYPFTIEYVRVFFISNLLFLSTTFIVG